MLSRKRKHPGKKDGPKSPSQRDRSESAGKQEGPKSPGQRDMTKSAGKRDRSKSAGKPDGPKSAGKRDRSKSTGKRDGPKSAGKRDRSKSAGKPDGPKSAGKRDRSKSTGKRDGPKSAGKRDGPKSAGKQDGPKSAGKRDGPKSAGKRDGPKSAGKWDKSKSPGQRKNVDGGTNKSPSKTIKRKGPAPRGAYRGPHKERIIQETEEELKKKNLMILSKTTKDEKPLVDLVFGGEDDLVDKLLSDSKIKALPGNNLLEDDSDDEEWEDFSSPAKKPAWVDEEDEVNESIKMTHRYRKDMMKGEAEKIMEKEKLQARLKQEFQKAMGGVPSWASRVSKRKASRSDDDDDEDDEDAEDNLLSKTGNLIAKSTYLTKGTVQIKKCTDANKENPSASPLTTVQFHPLAQVVMTAGVDRTVSFFQVDGITNPKIQSIFLKSFPVFKARFSADGEQVITTGCYHKIFYVYDMIGGKIIPVPNIRGLEEKRIKNFEVSPDGSLLLLHGASGFIHLLSMKSKELIGSMKMNSQAMQCAFSPDTSKIFSATDSGEVYIWDVKSRRCLNRFMDDGSIYGTSLAVSKDGRYVSCGSSSGVVNVYNSEDCLQSTSPKPMKSIMNLITSASSQVFNPLTEMMAIASDKMDEAVKLVHIPTFTVFANFPAQGRRKSIYLPKAMDFSPNSGYFSIANNKGKALLYRIKHYSDF